MPVVTCEDEMVMKEERKVREGDTSGDILTLRELTKVFDRDMCQRGGRVAVNSLNLSMKPSEVKLDVHVHVLWQPFLQSFGLLWSLFLPPILWCVCLRNHYYPLPILRC